MAYLQQAEKYKATSKQKLRGFYNSHVNPYIKNTFTSCPTLLTDTKLGPLEFYTSPHHLGHSTAQGKGVPRPAQLSLACEG